MKKIDKPIYIRLGKQLKEARLRKGYSLAEVAEMVGRSKVSIKRYEDATVRIDMETLNKLSNIYGLAVVEGTAEVNGKEVERLTFLAPKLDEQWYEQDREAQEFASYLADLSEKMFEKFMHLDIDHQKIVLMMLKMNDIEEIINRIH